MFRLDHRALDQRIDQRLNRRSGREGREPFPDSAGPGFLLAEIFDELTDSAGGARTRALSSFVYSVFTGGLAGASMPTPGKPVLFARGRLTFGTRAPYLALGAAGDERLLIPFPKVDEQLLARPVHGTVGLSRDAVHTAAEDIVERVNIGWPAALALAAIDTAH